MNKVQDIHGFPGLKIKLKKKTQTHKVALLYSEYSFQKFLITEFS